MNCTTAQNRLIDNPELQDESVLSHLETCRSCRELKEQLLAISSATQRLASQPYPEELALEIYNKSLAELQKNRALPGKARTGNARTVKAAVDTIVFLAATFATVLLFIQPFFQGLKGDIPATSDIVTTGIIVQNLTMLLLTPLILKRKPWHKARENLKS